MNHLKTKTMPMLFKLFLITVACSFVFAGCAATKRARDVEYKGYMVDASILKKGGQDEALYVYRNPKADWPSYSKILLDPVVNLRQATLEQAGIPLEDLQRLANNFYALLYKELDRDYEMVKMPGPRTMRIQVAITDLQESWATTDTITSVIPVGIAISSGKEFITGKPAFVGEATIEAKITDGRTGQLLAAGIDRRVGGNEIKATVDSWDDVNKIMELWSRFLRFRLCKLRGERDCFLPE